MPKTKNESIQIAHKDQDNNVLLALAGANLDETQLSICLAVIGKASEWVDSSTFCKLTNHSQQIIDKTLENLTTRKFLLTNKTNEHQLEYKLNQNFSEWMTKIQINNNINLADQTKLSLFPNQSFAQIDVTQINNSPTARYDMFVSEFNKIFKRHFRRTATMVAKLQTRLKSYTFDEIMTALNNLGNWEWAKGDNNRGWQATPDFLIRNDAQIDRFLNMKQEKKIHGFVAPDKRLAVEITLMASLVTGAWDNSVKAIYGQELLPWLEKENKFIDFKNGYKLLIKFIQNQSPRIKVTELSWTIIIQTYYRYIETCKKIKIKPRKEIIERGKRVIDEHSTN